MKDITFAAGTFVEATMKHYDGHHLEFESTWLQDLTLEQAVDSLVDSALDRCCHVFQATSVTTDGLEVRFDNYGLLA